MHYFRRSKIHILLKMPISHRRSVLFKCTIEYFNMAPQIFWRSSKILIIWQYHATDAFSLSIIKNVIFRWWRVLKFDIYFIFPSLWKTWFGKRRIYSFYEKLVANQISPLWKTRYNNEKHGIIMIHFCKIQNYITIFEKYIIHKL